MTTKGRRSDPDMGDALDNNQTDERSSQAPSGVFRAAGETRRRDSGWTVTEQFVREGFSYRLMRRPLELAKIPPRLTKREEDAVVLACAGHSNKSIAQALDVSPSTIGVLLFRAAGKLNAKSRSELLSNYEQFKAAAAIKAAANQEPDGAK
jgi:DNA-binding CsgD family transcriptional regulator